MKIRGSVVSQSFIFPHPPEDEEKKKKVKYVYALEFPGDRRLHIQ